MRKFRFIKQNGKQIDKEFKSYDEAEIYGSNKNMREVIILQANHNIYDK